MILAVRKSHQRSGHPVCEGRKLLIFITRVNEYAVSTYKKSDRHSSFLRVPLGPSGTACIMLQLNQINWVKAQVGLGTEKATLWLLKPVGELSCTCRPPHLLTHFEAPTHTSLLPGTTSCCTMLLPLTRKLAVRLGLHHNLAVEDDAEILPGFPHCSINTRFTRKLRPTLAVLAIQTHPGRGLYVTLVVIKFGDRCVLSNFITLSQESLLLSPSCFFLGAAKVRCRLDLTAFKHQPNPARVAMAPVTPIRRPQDPRSCSRRSSKEDEATEGWDNQENEPRVEKQLE